MTDWRLLTGDVRVTLAGVAPGSVQTCVTSPPYWGLRDYGDSSQIGLEPTPDAYVAQMVAVFREVRRVLADDGTCWLNLGDSYANTGNDKQSDFSASVVGYGGTGRATVGGQPRKAIPSGLKPKDLVGIPWRVAFALQADGWYLRSDIIWHKPNPMPESVQDRPTKAHEYLFLLSKSPRYYYDAAAIREAAVYGENRATFLGGTQRLRAANVCSGGLQPADVGLDRPDTADRNKRSVWTVATQPYADAHFATFPEALIEPCILAGSRVGDLVLDPFAGSGTTGAVAIRHQRRFVGCELNPAYVALARTRIGAVMPLFAVEVTA